jgi:hypothetical protein
VIAICTQQVPLLATDVCCLEDPHLHHKHRNQQIPQIFQLHCFCTAGHYILLGCCSLGSSCTSCSPAATWFSKPSFSTRSYSVIMLPALLGRQKAVQHLAASCSSILRSCCCSGHFASLQQQLQQHPQQQQPQQLQQHAGFAAAVPSILSDASVLRAPPPGKSGLVVQYPFDVEYYSPRRVTLYNLDKQPLAAVELPGDIFNVPGVLGLCTMEDVCSRSLVL